MFSKKIKIKNIKKKPENKKEKIRDRINNFLELPKEAITKALKITAINNKEVLVEGSIKIEDYLEGYIRLGSENTRVSIEGKDLTIKELTDLDVIITGEIESIKYI